jgi:hypothetical protein
LHFDVLAIVVIVVGLFHLDWRASKVDDIAHRMTWILLFAEKVSSNLGIFVERKLSTSQSVNSPPQKKKPQQKQ